MTKLTRFFYFFGVHAITSKELSARILYSNQITFVCSILSLIFSFIFYWLSYPICSFICLGLIVLFSMTSILNYYHYFYLSRFSYLIFSNLSVVCFSLLFGRSAGFHYLNLGLVLFPIIVFEPKETRSRYFGVFLCIFNFIFLEVCFSYNFIPPVYPQTSNYIFYFLMIGVTYIFVCMSMLFFISSEKKSVVLQKKLDDKSTLLREIHHRVKNNLQVISSLLSLQSNYVDHPDMKKLVTEFQNRIQSFAYIHQTIGHPENVGRVTPSTYLKLICDHLKYAYLSSDSKVAIHTSIPKDISIDLDKAHNIGMLVNEIVTNAIKHAFSDTKKGIISINWKSHSTKDILSISDNGKGMKELPSWDQPNSFGLKLISILTSNLDATLTMDIKSGTTFTFSIPN